MKARLKITVIKKLSWKEMFPEQLPQVPEEVTEYCNRLDEGSKFIVEEDGKMPEGFCTWAWSDIWPVICSCASAAISLGSLKKAWLIPVAPTRCVPYCSK